MRILDVFYDNLLFDDAVDRLSALYALDRPSFVTYLNIDCLRLTAELPDYKAILQNADMVLPDGTALRIATRMAGQRKADHYIITDVFVVVTGDNDRQVEAIVDEVEEKVRLAGHKPIRREGQRDGRWVLLDYGDVVVHVQHAEQRIFYALERLWKDCPFLEFDEKG